jgi:hypothetical protein
MQKTASEGRFACQPCDRGFDTERDQQAHIRTHEKCHHAGCPFEAVHKVLLSHLLKEHGRRAGGGSGTEGASGGGGAAITLPPSLLELIPEKYRGAAQVGNSAEEISRWREERRKHFPTAVTIARRQEKQAARDERGELARATDTGKMKHAQGAAASTTAAKKAEDDNKAAETAPAAVATAASVDDDEEEEDVDEEEAALAAALGLAAAASTTAATGTDSSSAEPAAKRRRLDDGSAADKDKSASGERPVGADDDDEAPDEEPVAHTAADLSAAQQRAASAAAEEDTRLGVISSKASVPPPGSASGGGMVADSRPVCRMYQQGRCKLGRQCRFSHDFKNRSARDGASSSSGNAGSKSSAVCRWYLLGTCGAGTRCPYQHSAVGDTGAPTAQLLRKLLAKDLQRETSILLQAVRYVVRQNFFVPSAEPSAASTAGLSAERTVPEESSSACT